MKMTKAEYITLRKSGKKRSDIQKEHFGNDSITFKTFLSMTGLLSLETELIALRDMDKPKELPFEPTKQEVEKVEYPPVTKELVESELAKGKSVSQIERDNGMKLNTLPWKMKSWGIINPNPRKKANVQESAVINTKQAESMHESPEMEREPVENVQEAEDTVIKHPETEQEEVAAVKSEAEPTKFVYFQIPIIKGYEEVDRGFSDLFGAIRLAAKNNVDLVRSAEELFMVMQRYTQLLHLQMETLIVEGNPAEHVQKFIQKHNTIHINKQTVTK